MVTGCQENKSCSEVLNFRERLDDRIFVYIYLTDRARDRQQSKGASNPAPVSKPDPQTNWPTDKERETLACMQVQRHTEAHTAKDTHAHTLTRVRAHTHVRWKTHIHTHTRTHDTDTHSGERERETHTHTHTHTHRGREGGR